MKPTIEFKNETFYLDYNNKGVCCYRNVDNTTAIITNEMGNILFALDPLKQDDTPLRLQLFVL